MTGVAGSSPDTASCAYPGCERSSEPGPGGGSAHNESHTAGADPLEALADKFLVEALAEALADQAHMAAAVVTAVRAHQDTTGRHAAAQALRDAADALEVNAPVIAKRATSKTNAVHLAARRVAARADALDVS